MKTNLSIKCYYRINNQLSNNQIETAVAKVVTHVHEIDIK